MAEQQTSDSSKALVVVSENGVEYSLLKEPNETSMYVMEDHKTLNENLQISELTLELTDVRKHMLVVYCDAIGHLQLECKSEIDQLYSVVKLCDDIVHTLNEFSWVSNNAIVNNIIMATAYEYLVMGFKI